MIVKALSDLSDGEKGRIEEILLGGEMRRRLLDMGLTANTEVECVGRSPLGDPAAYLVRGAVIAIRDDAAGKIRVSEVGKCQDSTRETDAPQADL